MADEQRPGQGVIVRADFGGGIDQSSDAWKVPPNQLASLLNGRLEKVGSIRKRTGYQAAAEPSASNTFTVFQNVLAGSSINFATPSPIPVPSTSGVIEAGRPLVVGSKIVFIALMAVPTTPASTLYYFVTYDPTTNACVGTPWWNYEETDTVNTSNVFTDGIDTVWTRYRSDVYKYTVSTNTITSFAAGAALEGWSSAIGTPIVNGFMYAIDNIGLVGLGRMYKTDLTTQTTTTVGTDRKDTKKLLGHVVRSGQTRLLTVHMNNVLWTDPYGNNALVELSVTDRSVTHSFGAIPTGYLLGPNSDDTNLGDRSVWVDSAQRAYLTLNGYAYMIDYSIPIPVLTNITGTLAAVPGFVTNGGFPITTATFGKVPPSTGRVVGGGLSVTYDETQNLVWFSSCPVSGSTFPTVAVALNGSTGAIVEELRYSPATPIMGIASINSLYRMGTGRVQASPTSAITQTNVWGPQTITSTDGPEPGHPVATAASSEQTVVIDATKDWTPASEATDRWTHGLITAKIGNESGYVARNYTPTTTVTNDWTSTGPASDVIGDIVVLDGNAGDVDECVDFGTEGNWIFVTKVTRAVSETSTSYVTVTQYDAVTNTVISEVRTGFASARMYPKLLVFPTLNRILVAVANYSQIAGPYTGTIEFLWYSYSDAGLTYNGVLAHDIWREVNFIPLTYFVGTPDARFRPVIPFDVVATGDTSLHLIAYNTSGLPGTTLRCVRYSVTVSGVTLATTFAYDPPSIGTHQIQAITMEYGQPDTINGATLIVSAFAAEFNTAVYPYFVAANYQLHAAIFSWATCGALAYSIRNISRASASAIPLPGRLTVVQHETNDGTVAGNYGVALGYIEVYEALTGSAATHTLFIVHSSASALSIERRSYAIPASRAFELDYYDRAAVGGESIDDTTQARLALIVGVSQQSYLGRLLNNQITKYAGNYSATIGTQILTGARLMTLSCANSPFQTFAPKFQACPPPRPIKVNDKWMVPHLVAIDGSNGFAIALIGMSARAAGDAQPSGFSNQPVFPAGIVQQSDGERFAEVALVDRPAIHDIQTGNTGTPLEMKAGDYLIQAVAVYRDSMGNVHRSAPSDPYRLIQPTSSIPLTWIISFSNQSYTLRDDVQIEFFCTEPNGSILRYWFTVPNTITMDYNTATVHDPQHTTVTPQKGAIGLPPLDARTLYTTGGVLPNVPVPSARFATLFKNRMIVGGSDDPKSIYYSNAPQAYQAASFAIGNVIRMEHEGGCTACGTLNDKLILFSTTGVYATFGQFRDATGAGDALAELESIHDYIGCNQPISCVSIPLGLIFFATDNRFYMIDERLGLNPIGLRVQETTQNGMNRVQAAVHIEAEREVRFYMRNDTEESATILVYNYQVDQWSQDLVQANVNDAPVIVNSWGGACMSPDLKCFVPTPQRWLTDDRTTYKDATYWITLLATTAWIQPAGTQEYTRFRYAQFLGRSMDLHGLSIYVYCDFDESTIRASGSWTAAQLAPIANTVWPAQVRLQIGTQKTQSVKISISDSEPVGATTGQGPQFVGLALEVLPLGGMKRLPATRKA